MRHIPIYLYVYMTTIKLKFRPSTVKGAEGTLYYQVIYQRNVRRMSSDYRIFTEEWDNEREEILIATNSERKYHLLNIRLSAHKEISRCKEIAEKMNAEGINYTIDDMCNAFMKHSTEKTVFTFLREQIEKKELMGRQGTLHTYLNAYRRFREFRQSNDLTFDELSPDMMEHYEAWLTNRGLQQNSIRFYLRTLNTLYHKAVIEGVTPDNKIFDRVHLSFVKTRKRAISETDIRAIKRLILPKNSPIAFARDIFMFSFYMRGMPFVDIAYLRKSDLRYGMLSYCRKKNNQFLTIEWEREQQEIVERYAPLTKDTPYMLPIILREDGTEYRQYRLMQESVNRNLKKIGEMIGLKIPLTSYVARHSWASLARNMNFSIAIISEGMGHHSYKTTQTYLDSIDTSQINDANRKIIRRIYRGK